MPNWVQRLNPVIPGEPIDASVANRAVDELDERTQYLKALLELALLGRALVDPDAAVASDVLVGQTVWFNAAAGRYEKALNSVAMDPTTGLLVPEPAALVRGIVYRKQSATVADIALLGLFKGLSLENAVTGTVENGQYFLGSQVAGTLTQQRVSQAAPVAFVDGDAVWVYPSPRFGAEDHTHIRIELVCRPAGDHAAVVSGTHTITGADTALQGWLPANHASFDGNAPTGAKFGYNIEAHAAVKNIWPTVGQLTFTWDKGKDRVGGTEIPQGTGGAIVADRNGIWWLSDCFEDVPWPNVAFVDGAPEEEEEPPACPRPETMRLSLSFATSLIDLRRAFVTSLQLAAGSNLTLTDCNGQPATVGDLVIGTNWALLLDPTVDNSPLALKGITAGKFTRGPVVTGLLAGTNIELESDDIEAHETLGNIYHGAVTVKAVGDATGRELFPTTVRLDNADTNFEGGVMSIRLPKNTVSGFRAVYQVPSTGVTNGTALRFRFVFIGTTAGQLPTMTFAYRKIARPTTPTALPTSDTSLTPPTMPTLTAANQYAEISFDPITVNPGDTVFLSITRSNSDAYSGDPLVLRHSAILG